MIYIREYGNLRQISKQIFQLQLESYRINYIEKLNGFIPIYISVIRKPNTKI